jgi:hypothetical protein
MENNDELSLAWRFVENTGENLFLTGKAGTGKTTFLKNVRLNSSKRIVVLAPTGIAAINAGGVTIHSFFQLPLAPFIPDTSFRSADMKYRFGKEKISIIRSLDLLIIDEISMVRADLLDAVDDSLRRYRDHYKPFGGVQLLMIGDIQQLAPVAKDSDWALLKNYYDSPYFFDSIALKKSSYRTIELKKVYRQQDNEFIELLNKIRENKADSHVLSELNKRYIPNFKPKKEDGFIRLTTHNYQSQQINRSELSLLTGSSYSFHAKVKDDFPQTSYPADETLILKKGAQVMFLKNDVEHRYYNGMIGTVTYVDSTTIMVQPKDSDEAFELEPAEWTNSKYVLDNANNEISEEVMGVFSQYPLRLAWAITIHKSQGLTFDRAIIDAHLSFAHGQTYVALSRCRSLNGIVLETPLTASSIIADDKVDNYSSDMLSRTPDENQLRELEKEYALNILRELFNFSMVASTYDSVVRLISDSLIKRYASLMNEYHDKMSVINELQSVAHNFEIQYTRMLTQSDGNLSDDAIQKRIHSGANYFIKQLEPICKLASITNLLSDNKVVMNRIKLRVQAFRDELKVKTSVLAYASDADETFTINGYLRAKDIANIDGKRKEKANRDKKIKEKVERVDTKTVSYNMFLSGKSIPQIAKERNLTTQTIANHLVYFVAMGLIPVEKFISYDKYNAIIAYIIAHPDIASSLTDVKAAMGDGYSYEEIKFAFAGYRSQSENE